ncbi:MAG: hypothetical protein M0Z89_13720 [Nitrospiraceae bacterium]|nr:hypothetical protein [Nitrospiraceae bacterium]
MTTRQYGKWSKLTDHLINDGSPSIRLHDDQMQHVAGSIDESKPYDIDFTDPNYCIRRRANDAGYDVTYDPTDKSIKVFTKMRI